MEISDEKRKEGLIILGCPEAPAQVSLAVHLAHGLRRSGYAPVVAGNPSARQLLAMADPEHHYIGEMLDLERCIEEISTDERDYDLSFVLVHRESGVSYAGTVSVVSAGRVVAVVFGKEAEALASLIDFDCETVVAPAVHNPMPLKKAIDRVMKWDV
ncbi:DUF1890 domain-containing protein [Methanofollis formosanus]|uniref:DUF1890 domain-containing protein n=1 Tax=Methanofollis formosanus TaxID=299308 RepID=A0A8G1A172_9EURY|nr:DUF1890 domain-containing protein [Methanofollis formosanus]QYZ78519.1 DUF1890 domain-containing protein [Methanofollis formosanus]